MEKEKTIEVNHQTEKFIKAYKYLKKTDYFTGNSDLARQIRKETGQNVSSQAFSKFLHRKRNVSKDILNNFIKTFGLNANYFFSDDPNLFGKGSIETADIDLTKPKIIPVDTYNNGSNVKVLPIVVDRDDRENITLVTTQAAAGYVENLAEPEYISSLPSFYLPMPEFRNGTFRCFPVIGESMAPGLMPGSYVIAKYVDNLNNINDGRAYVVVYNGEQRPVIKRVKKRIADLGKLILQSDNIGYSTYSIDVSDVKEVWLYICDFKFTLHRTAHDLAIDVNELKSAVGLLEEQISDIAKKVK